MTATERSVKKEIKQLVDELTLEEAQDLLDTLNLRFEGGPLTEEEQQAVEEADAEYARGETVSLDDVKRELEPCSSRFSLAAGHATTFEDSHRTSERGYGGA